MKRTAGLALAALFCVSIGNSSSYYVLEVRGGSRIYAADRPVQKGRVYLFHRFPDGVYMSLPATEVERVATATEPPPPERLAPGQTLYVGPALPSNGFAPAPPPVRPAAPADTSSFASGYGYYGDYGGGGGGYVPPRPPGPVSSTRIGPNGFPILAPPGSPGSTPPPIGPNGFPVLAPQPPVA